MAISLRRNHQKENRVYSFQRLAPYSAFCSSTSCGISDIKTWNFSRNMFLLFNLKRWICSHVCCCVLLCSSLGCDPNKLFHSQGKSSTYSQDLQCALRQSKFPSFGWIKWQWKNSNKAANYYHKAKTSHQTCWRSHRCFYCVCGADKYHRFSEER